MRRIAKLGLVAVVAGAVAAVVARFRRSAEAPVAPADDRADELRRKLAEARAAAVDQDDFEAAGMGAETIVEEPPAKPPAPVEPPSTRAVASVGAAASAAPGRPAQGAAAAGRVRGDAATDPRGGQGGRRRDASLGGPRAAQARPALSVHRNEHTVEIAAPPGDVFPWLVGAEERLRWMGALVESEALDNEPPAVGSRFRDVFEDHGQRIELEAELVTYEPPHALEVRLVADAFEATSRSRLEQDGPATRLTAQIETTYKALAARLLGPVVTRHAQKQLESDLARLKDLVEAGAAPPP